MFDKSKMQGIQLLTFSLVSVPICIQADECRYIENDKERLACYDTMNGRGFETVKHPPHPTDNHEVKQGTEAVQTQKQSKRRLFRIPKLLNAYGLDRENLADARGNRRATILSFSRGSDGKVVVETDQGTYQLLERVRRTSNHEKQKFVLIRDAGILGIAIRFGNLNGWHKVKK